MVRLALDHHGLKDRSIPRSLQGSLSLCEWDTFSEQVQRIISQQYPSRKWHSSILLCTACLLMILIVLMAAVWDAYLLVPLIGIPMVMGAGIVGYGNIQRRRQRQEALRNLCRQQSVSGWKFALKVQEGNLDAIDIERVVVVCSEDEEKESTNAVKDVSIVDAMDLSALDQETAESTDDDEEQQQSHEEEKSTSVCSSCLSTATTRTQAGPREDEDADTVSLHPPKRRNDDIC